MSATKQTSRSAIGPVGDLAWWAAGRGRTVTAGLLVIAVFLMAWWWVWQWVGPRVTRSEQYLVELDDLQSSPQPQWVHTDIRTEVYESLRFGGAVNLLDNDLSPRVAEAFARHPWVERVVRVGNWPGRGVQVELEYRRPVCVVKVDGRLWPIDHRSILLPAEGMSREDIERYPQLVGIDSPPLATYGEPWGSMRVAGGAAVADALSEVWESWHLVRIVPFPVVAPDGRERVHYNLFTAGGTRIGWGLPPGIDSRGEPSVEEKLARLTAYRARHGTFDGSAGPLDLDVRAMGGYTP